MISDRGRGYRRFLFVSLVLFLLPVSGTLFAFDEEALEECCQKAYQGCAGTGGDEKGSFNLGAFCAIYDYYGHNSNHEGASDKLKAAQKCMDLACPVTPTVQKPPPPKEEEKRLPIIFLPGVAASMLESGERELWPLAPYGDRGDLAFEPDGKTSARKATVVVGDILRSRPTMNFYGHFVESLKTMGYAENTDLYLFPYDWRYDNASHYDRLDQVINTALSNTKTKKAILIAHSMGGVIARGYVYSGSERAAKVDSFITMGTPYWGAPKVYYALINGYQFGNDSVRQELMKVIMQNYAAGYQLLPQIPFITDTSSGRMLSLEESNSIRYKWFVSATYGIRDIYTPTEGNERFFNPGLLSVAKQFFSAVGNKDAANPLPGGVKQFAIIGYGVSTLGGFKLEDWKPGALFSGSYLELGNRKVVLHPVSVDGDGTVPLWSLETSAATKSYYIPYKSGFLSDESTSHADLPANKTIQSIVAEIVKYQSGLSPALPDSNQYPRPAEYMGMPMTPGKEIESIGQFELHSDAHLRIQSGNGKKLGFNSEGGIEETLPGTFLSMDGVEYASIAELNSPLQVTVTGIREGRFTLDVHVKRRGDTLSKFSYHEVPVQNGTVAEVTMTLAQASEPPALKVTTNGSTSTVAATVSLSGSATAATVQRVRGWGAREENIAYNGTNLTYYPRPSADQCQADCGSNEQCKGFTWISPGTYNPSDPGMCYLVSVISGRSNAKGHISAEKTNR